MSKGLPSALASAAADAAKSTDTGTPPAGDAVKDGAPPADTKVDAKATDAKVDGKADAKVDDAAAKAAAELASKPFTDLKQLSLKDGLQVDEAVMKDFLPLAGKLGLTAGQAQALIEFNATLGSSAEKARAAAQDEAAKKAVESLKSDPDIGGKHFDASMKLAAKALTRFGGKPDPETGKSPLVDAIEQVQLADGSMLGDSLLFAKFLVNIGKTLSEDSASARSGASAKTPANDNEAFLKDLYPNSPDLFPKR